MKTKQKNKITKKQKRNRRKTRKNKKRQKGGNVGLITNELNNELQDYYFEDLQHLDNFLSVLSTSSEMNIDDLLENMRDE